MTSVVIHNTQFTGKFLIHEESMTSTNAYANQWISKTNPTDGTVILADFQTAGRGQHNNSWEALSGENLTCSIIYKPDFLQASDQYTLNMAVALGVRQTVQEFLPDSEVRVKWPNDIMVGNGKVAGVLIENTLHGRKLKNTIIGIGLNINQTDFEGLPHAVSLKLESGQSFDRLEVLNVLCLQVESQYLRLRHGQAAGIVANYNEYLFGKNEEVLCMMSGTEQTIIPSHVSADGRIAVRHQGEMKSFLHGEFTWLI